MRGGEIVAESEVRRSQSFQRLVSDSTLSHPGRALAQVCTLCPGPCKRTHRSLWPPERFLFSMWLIVHCVLKQPLTWDFQSTVLLPDPPHWPTAGGQVEGRSYCRTRLRGKPFRKGNVRADGPCGSVRRAHLLLKSSQSGLRRAAASNYRSFVSLMS